MLSHSFKNVGKIKLISLIQDIRIKIINSHYDYIQDSTILPFIILIEIIGREEIEKSESRRDEKRTKFTFSKINHKIIQN